MKRRARRVLITLDAVGGVWQYGLDLARGLAARDTETILVILGPAPDAAQLREAHGIAGATVLETGLALDWLSDGPGPVMTAGATMAEIASDMHADIVQFNMPTLAATAMPVPVVAVTHGCVGTWWQAARPDERLPEAYGWHRAMTHKGLRTASRVVAPSTAYAEVVRDFYDLPAAPLVVHNGRSPLMEAGKGPPATRALTVGRLWDRVKQAHLLDQVAGRLDLPFEAAGAATGPHGERVNLKHLVTLGQLDANALGRRLQGRPIFVSAASFEPFGLAVLEAAQAGCPLVLSDIAVFRELWNDAALFVPLEDAEGYLGAVRHLLDAPDERLRLGEAARRRAARFTPQNTADAMLAIYASALTEHASGKIAA